MATTYKTPGVYIEEIVKFPPSVAQVETAIPAFIGYTERAEKKNGDSLELKPHRISSLLEYETYFGSAKKEEHLTVSVINNELINVTAPPADKKSPFLMYYTLQLYFANGGGPCYIVSVDQYGAAANAPATLVSKADLSEGLTKIRKEDEPTLLLFPDATNIGNTDDFYALYNDALIQCNELQDRFTIIDTESDDEENKTPIADLRNKVSNDKDYVKYGAAYYPFLETILDYVYDDTKIDVTQQSTDPDDIKLKVQNISNGIDTVEFTGTAFDALEAEITAATGADANETNALAIAFIPAVKSMIGSFKTLLSGVITDLNSTLVYGRQHGAEVEANLLDTWITDEMEQAHLNMSKAIDRLNLDDTKTKLLNEITLTKGEVDTIKTKLDALKAAGELFNLIGALPGAGIVSTTVKLNTLESGNNVLFNRVKAAIGQKPLLLPPSGAMAGIYARVDNNRGVWKAPANVSLNYVIKPSLQISHDDQEILNVDVNAGKSVNAIRTFAGKGVLVWGARTLAGNDKEWRYISVRRFFNMAEESIKKATDQFVFEPNDKNTWVRVKAMIDNFLTLQWRAGALAGPTPEQAFYVKVGLGETMTAQDILDGFMIIEIGMAVVRPAEFIILKFSHKMQEA